MVFPGRTVHRSERARDHDEERHHLEVVAAREFARERMSAARVKQARDRTLLILPRHGRDGRRQQSPGVAHVLTAAGRVVETGTGAGIGQLATDAEALQPVQDLLGLQVPEQHGAVVADVYQIVRAGRIATAVGLGRGAADRPEQEDDPRGTSASALAVTAKLPKGIDSATPG